MIRALKSSFYRFVRTGQIAKVLLFALLIVLFDALFFDSIFAYFYLGSIVRPRYMDNTWALLSISVLAISTPFWCGLFASSFVGKDISYRTVNNKITTGISRTQIYLADLIVAETATIISVITSSAFICLIDRFLPVKSGFTFDGRLAGAVLRSIIICMAFMAFYVLLQYFLGNQIMGLIISLLTIFAVFAGTSLIQGRLEQPYKTVVSYEENGEAVIGINRHYVSGVPRNILTFLVDASPTSEGVYEIDEGDKIVKIGTEEGICAVAVFVMSTSAGLVAINKKEYS